MLRLKFIFLFFWGEVEMLKVAYKENQPHTLLVMFLMDQILILF